MYSFHVGVEKNNDTSKRNYFSSNRHNAPAEIIRSDFRLESLKRGVGVMEVVIVKIGSTQREMMSTGTREESKK